MMRWFRALLRLGVHPSDTAVEVAKKTQYTLVFLCSLVVLLGSISIYKLVPTVTATIYVMIGVSIVMLTSLVYLFITKRIPTELPFLCCSVLIFLSDTATAGIMNAPRAVPVMMVVMDARLLLQSDSTVTLLTAVATLIYLVFIEVEGAVGMGLSEKVLAEGEQLMYTCKDPPCKKTWNLALTNCLYMGSVFLLDFIATRHFSDTSEKERKRMEAAVETAEKVAQALANFDLDSAGEANRSELLPEGLVNAFRTLVSNLAMYKPYLPDSCLPEMLREGESNLENDKESSGGRRSSVSGHVSASLDCSTSNALGPATRTCMVTLMVFNIKGFLSYDWEIAHTVHTALLSSVGPAVHAFQGLIDGFSGDRIRASFNGARSCSQHACYAARCALTFLRKWNAEHSMVTTSIGIATGHAVCGVLGDDRLRGYGVVGKVGCWVHVVERWATQRGIPVLCTGATYRDAVFCAEGRLELDRIVIQKHNLKTLALWEVIKERPISTGQEWMYAVEEVLQHDPWKAYNDAVRFVHKGLKDRATEILRTASFKDGVAEAAESLLQLLLTSEQQSWEVEVQEVGQSSAHQRATAPRQPLLDDNSLASVP